RTGRGVAFLLRVLRFERLNHPDRKIPVADLSLDARCERVEPGVFEIAATVEMDGPDVFYSSDPVHSVRSDVGRRLRLAVRAGSDRYRKQRQVFERDGARLQCRALRQQELSGTRWGGNGVLSTHVLFDGALRQR